MSCRPFLATCCTIAALGGSVLGCAAPEPEESLETGRLEFSSSSAESRQALEEALTDMFNVFTPRAVLHADEALALDSTFGLARAVRASIQPGQSPEEREAELDRAVADAATASPGELALAATFRARSLGRPEEARGLAELATELLPNDPTAAFLRASSVSGDEQIEAMREVTERFPEFPAAHNILAYRLVETGDTAGALTHVQRYMELLPSHPNSHDSYAELLQFMGRYDEAIPHYQRAIELDETYSAAYTGLGEANLLSGNGAAAREAYARAAEHAATPIAALNFRAWETVTYLVDGTPADAVREMVALADEAEQEGVSGLAANLHWNAAITEAVFGNGASVAGHLARSAALGGGDTPVYHRAAAIAYALSGRLDEARSEAATFEEIASGGPAAQQANAREVRAILAVADGDLALARTELEEAEPPLLLGKAVLAEALEAAGQADEAQALEDEILGSRGVAFFDILARAKAGTP